MAYTLDLNCLRPIIREKQYYKVNLGLKDMQFCIDFARLLMRFCAR